MKLHTHKLRLAIVSLFIALPLFGVTQVMAQEQDFTPELYTSELSGFDIEVAGPQYAITGAELEHYANGEGEIVDIEGEYATIEVSFFDDADTPEDSLDAYIGGIEQAQLDYTEIDRGVEGDTTYAILLIHYEGVDVLYYMQVTEDVTGNVDLFETLLTLPELLEVDLDAAQEEIAIDGAPFMENVVADDILEVVDSGDSGDDTATPDTTPNAGEDDSNADPVTPAATLPIDLAGVDFEVSEDFDVVGDPIIEEGIEGYALTSRDHNLVVAVGETGLTPAQTVESFSSGFGGTFADAEVVDSEQGDDLAWTLFSADVEGEQRLLLIAVDTTTLPGYETLVGLEMPTDDVAGSVELVQDGLSIDGQPLLSSIDADHIASLVSEGDATDDADVTPEATEDDEPDTGADDPRDDAKLPTGGEDEDSNTSETNTTETDTESTPEETEEPTGQSGDSSWTSPIYGNDVSWDSSVWMTDLEDPEFVESDEAGGYEFLMVTADSTLLYFEFYDDTHTPAEFLEQWTSDDYLNRTTSTGGNWEGELLSSRSRDGGVGVVIRYTSDSGEYTMVREAVEMADGTVMVTTLDAETANLGLAHADAQAGVTVNSDSVLNLFSTSQIERLIEE